MRSVSFVKHIELSFFGNIHQSALCLGDVDNDGNDELIIGNTDGNLFIYKEQECVQIINSLGMITAVGVGDILKCGSNVLIVIAGDGWCHIYLCLSGTSEDNTSESPSFKLKPVYVQRIPANTKTLLIGDIDDDGCLELVLGLTDRVVRSYRWMQNFTGGRLVCLNKWECANQIGNVTLSYDINQQPCLLISQPGGTFMKIQCHTNQKSDSAQMTVKYHPSMSTKIRNNGISSKIIGNLHMYQRDRDMKQNESSLPYAIATLDGTLMLFKDEKMLWSYHVDQQLFVLNKMDVTGDGSVELIACSWEGYTYILDQYKNAIKFQTQEPVADFCAGLYKLKMTPKPVPCLIYATFHNKILIFYDVGFPDITAKNLIQLIEQKEDERDERESKSSPSLENIHRLKKISTKKLLLNWCLYGNHNLRS
ncbi:KICSTOR complex protein ITFG2-like [Planococcus citri]|uniref:KICSTOR complex protein ITFG2-like n=1 Tax=Planococcus citri TaxID=170843 RepID=UPI0031F88D16